MAKKKKKKKITVYGAVEGDREKLFLAHLVDIYNPKNHGINEDIQGSSGGKPDKILRMALNQCHRNRSFAWFDEDFESVDPLSSELKEKLAECWQIKEENTQAFFDCPLKDMQTCYNPNGRKPSLIISQPVCVESLILRALGKKIPYEVFEPNNREKQIIGLKDYLENSVIGKSAEKEYYQKHLTQDVLEEKRKIIPELDLLISMITN